MPSILCETATDSLTVPRLTFIPGTLQKLSLRILRLAQRLPVTPPGRTLPKKFLEICFLQRDKISRVGIHRSLEPDKRCPPHPSSQRKKIKLPLIRFKKLLLKLPRENHFRLQEHAGPFIHAFLGHDNKVPHLGRGGAAEVHDEIRVLR